MRLLTVMRFQRIGLTLLALLSATTLMPIILSLAAPPGGLRVVAQTTAERKAEADRLWQQGIGQLQTNRFQEALQSWQQALSIYREIHDRQNEGGVLGNLGGAYLYLGNYAKAIEYEQQSLTIKREIHERDGEGIALNNLGLALLKSHNLKEIEKHTILTAPSIQVLNLTHQQRAQVPGSAKDVLVAGNPTMPIVQPPGQDQQQLPQLPGAEQEALDIAQLLHTQALIGKQANKAAIVQELPKAKMIHLATHGLLDDFKGAGVPGAIALGPAKVGQPNDGLLTADEILDMKLSAELVVLSACDTGQGKITGDGVVGLSRSLITVGVPSIIVSLWSVPDAPTASLMKQFYTNLQHNPDKAQALRQAMLTTMKEHPEPRNWAAFTLIGESQ